MKKITNRLLPVILLIVCMALGTTSAPAKRTRSTRNVYYIVCGSYSSLDDAIRQSENMSEVLFYPVYKAKVNGKTVYRLCCECYYNKADAEKDLNGILSGFKADDWWIWQSKGLAKCVYQPYSPKGDGERIPVLKPNAKALTED